MRNTERSNNRHRQRRWPRVLIIVLVVLGLLAVVGQLTFPYLAESYVRGKITDVSERLDRTITFDSFELERLNRYHFTNLIVSESGDLRDQTLFTAEEVTVTLDRTAFFTGGIVLRQLEMVTPRIRFRDYPDGSSNYAGTLSRILRRFGLVPAEATDPETTEPETDEAADQEDRSGSKLAELLGSGIPEISISGAEIDLSDVAQDDYPTALRDINIEVTPTGDGFACEFSLSAGLDFPEIPILSRPIDRFDISGHVTPNDAVGEVAIEFGEPIELANLPGYSEVLLRVSTIGFEYPDSLHVGGVEILDRRTRSRVLEAGTITVSVRELTANPELFHLRQIGVESAKLYVEIDRHGRTNIARLMGVQGAGPLAELLPEGRRQPEPEDAPELTPPPAVEEERVAEAEPSAWERELSRRRWWEIVPDLISLTDVSMEILVHREGVPIRTLDLVMPNISASKRLLNLQMDISSRAQLSERGVGEVGSIDLEFVYYYVTEHWQAELGFERVDLGQLVDVLPFPNTFGIKSGHLNGNLRMVDNRPERALDVIGDISMNDFAIDASTLSFEEMEGLSFRYDFLSVFRPDGTVSMRHGRFYTGDVEADVVLSATDFEFAATLDYLRGFTAEHDDDYWEARVGTPPPWSEARLEIDLPPTPIMRVYEAVPSALRAGLEGTEMTGDVAWTMHVSAQYERDDDGELSVTIPRPDEADVIDATVQLVSLPEPLDVRLLMEDFDFTFVDGIGEMRQMSVGTDNLRWVPLEQISPVMVQAILNTEDQNFFENLGFNWYQMRRVTADFLGSQEYGRGASTISMQLIKNLYLSRERILSRKLVEMFLTYWMTRTVLKERILEVYLNIIEFGPLINGIAEAAEHYFGKLASDLTLAESVYLVSIVPGPRQYHLMYEQGEIPDRWWGYMVRYMDRMLSREVITQEQYDEGISERPEFYIPGDGDPLLRPVPTDLPPDSLLPFLEENDVHDHENLTIEALEELRNR